MAKVVFKVFSKSNPANLNVRFYHNKIDLSTKTNIFIDPNIWSNKTKTIKQNIDENLKIEIRNIINNLEIQILNQFSKDYPSGNTIDLHWLNQIINRFNDKPLNNLDESIYFIPFLENYIEDSKNRVNPKTGQKISQRTIQNYTTTLRNLATFQDKIKTKLKHTDINLEFHKKYTSYLKLDCNYSNTLIEKYISQIKGFVKEAKIKGYETNIEIDSKKFSFQRDETIDTYLNLVEINKIYNLDLKDNEKLDKARDLLILGVWTGLRISDLKRINSFDITENRIRIIETEKTKSFIEIPIHPQLKSILIKRNNVFPEISEQKFNLYLKELCEKAGIDETTLGSIKNPETNRKEKGYYPKYKLISSHTCRRSFVSNHYGKISDTTIMAITSHKSHAQFMKYVKTTLKEHAEKLEEFWNIK